MSDYKCFVCSGIDEACIEEFYLPGEDKCVYYSVAQNDLQKHKEGNPNITLKSQLEEFLNMESLKRLHGSGITRGDLR